MIVMGLLQGFEAVARDGAVARAGVALASRFQRAELGGLQAGGGVDRIRAHRFFRTYGMRELDDNLQHLK